MSPEVSRALNALALLTVCGILLGGYYFQLVLGELPCPLCLLQRVGFVAVGFGLALNLIYGPRPSHYGIMLIGALFGGAWFLHASLRFAQSPSRDTARRSFRASLGQLSALLLAAMLESAIAAAL